MQLCEVRQKNRLELICSGGCLGIYECKSWLNDQVVLLNGSEVSKFDEIK